MIIGIDGNEANVEKRVGVSEFAYELLQHFSKQKEADLEFVIYLKDKPNSSMPSESAYWRYRIIGPQKLWTQFALPFDLLTHKPSPNVFFTPTHYAPRFSPVPTVVSVMDLSYLYYPELFRASDLYQLKNWTSYSVKNAKKIITISQSSKDDIMKQYKVKDDKISVIYPGLKGKLQSMKNNGNQLEKKEIMEKFGIDKKFILFVGTLQPRKNISRLIEAMKEVKKAYDVLLVIVGKKGWLYEEILAAPQKYNVEKEIKFLEFVSDDELGMLYEKAECFVLPSLYEGFGLPILEAMSQGCPVITSNVSSLPEVGGDAAVYFDPHSTTDISEKINYVLSSTTVRKKLIEKGYEQVKKFSWEKSAEKVLEILKEVSVH